MCVCVCELRRRAQLTSSRSWWCIPCDRIKGAVPLNRNHYRINCYHLDSYQPYKGPSTPFVLYYVIRKSRCIRRDHRGGTQPWVTAWGYFLFRSVSSSSLPCSRVDMRRHHYSAVLSIYQLPATLKVVSNLIREVSVKGNMMSLRRCCCPYHCYGSYIWLCSVLNWGITHFWSILEVQG